MEGAPAAMPSLARPAVAGIIPAEPLRSWSAYDVRDEAGPWTSAMTAAMTASPTAAPATAMIIRLTFEDGIAIWRDGYVLESSRPKSSTAFLE
jgi:hypothetical protein